MNSFIADLHIHSKFSRATSKNLTPRNLVAWASVKGIDVLATGDFTHPGWMQIVTEQLIAEENGLLRLRDDRALEQELPWFSGNMNAAGIRFLLCTEISSIYKKAGKVRKIHNLVFMPGIDAAMKFNTRLAQVGNLASDGRPILGLDAHDLLEMVLETDPLAYLVPAHIWTPWFSLFGSKSGFDRIEDCFGDLSGEIFALETGLSSDPEMNWMLSALDRFSLISNSDAHSGEKLGREANVFAGEMSFAGIRSALRRENGSTRFEGTLEFYPEEGKYHLDGHRKCGVMLEPGETSVHRGLCPVCGKPLTIGVLNRVLALSDRSAPVRPSGHPDYSSLVPLSEVLSEILGVGPGTKKVQGMYNQLVQDFGSELSILRHVPEEDLRRSSKILAEAVRRMRSGVVHRHSGYDGEYGRISMFTAQELLEFKHGRMLSMAAQPPAVAVPGQRWRKTTGEGTTPGQEAVQTANEMQMAAILAGPGPVLVLAGPGTGKTQTLMGRVRRLLEQGTDPARILILTFTRKAARELKDRLQRLCPGLSALPKADTLHALGLEYWTSVMGEAPVLLSEESSRRLFAAANPDLRGKELKTAWNEQSLARENGVRIPGEHTRRYLDDKVRFNLVDYTDLLEFWLEHLEIGQCVPGYDHVLVDEVQDLSALQLKLVTALCPQAGRGFFAIGDPNQAIYGFRGAVRDVEQRLRNLWPDLKRIRLARNYRSAQQILTLAAHLFPEKETLVAEKPLSASLVLFEAQGAEQEAGWIAGRVRELLGGTGHWQADTHEGKSLSPGDIAVLVRFKALIPPIARALEGAGIPVSVPEQESFFVDARVELLLRIAGNVLGLPDFLDGEIPSCPERAVEKGPLAMAVHFGETPPFDALFWKSKPFLDLVKAFQTCSGWRGLLNMVRLETELCAIRARAQKVQVMTMHGAKGLEFEVVFLPGLEEGILPFAGMDMLLGKPGDEGGIDLDEERRLFYVGLTRAKSMLFLSHCASRRVFGKTLKLAPSSLVRRLPQDMLRKSAIKRNVRVNERQLSLF
ncbi:MAG: UvrD-helicase domain-containing protein [Desulfomicrobium sp.]|nr:UvrD-helicase domain-containing protein [Pseudomonadota bacterium]MBV1712852.1 UvrD-helicase domain-containing protein [Desulfomicrobium sp.]MBU4571822.1 UvrD-helicase domain-containing protein [Pseudomonadota bacterium]MBU4595971.1 UvrD-helicase domain-containing protein [Pseudomonadota bacterium]MBV1721275.1 UvrD-helicase domain-containing protein [Desulfomicrobium sp.]